MKDAIEKMLIPAVTKVYGLSTDEVRTALYSGDDVKTPDEIIDYIVSKDAEKVSRLKQTITTKHDEGHKKGKAEALTAEERRLKDKYPDIDFGDKKLAEMIDTISEYKKTTGGSGKDTKEMTIDELKSLPVYNQAEQALIKKHEQEMERERKKYEEFSKKIEKKEKFNNVKSRALLEFEKLDPILSDDPVRKQNQRDVFIEKLENKYDDFEAIPETNEIFALKNSQRVEDGNGNPIKFNQIVYEITTSLYDLKKQQQKGSGGNDKNDRNDYTVPPGKLTEDEYFAEYSKLMKTDPLEAKKYAGANLHKIVNK